MGLSVASEKWRIFPSVTWAHNYPQSSAVKVSPNVYLDQPITEPTTTINRWPCLIPHWSLTANKLGLWSSLEAHCKHTASMIVLLLKYRNILLDAVSIQNHLSSYIDSHYKEEMVGRVYILLITLKFGRQFGSIVAYPLATFESNLRNST